MVTKNIILETPAFQKIIITLISIAFGTGLSAAYSIADYMHGVKSQFLAVELIIEHNHKQLNSKIDANQKLTQLKIEQDRQQIQIIRTFMTKYDDRIRKIEASN